MPVYRAATKLITTVTVKTADQTVDNSTTLVDSTSLGLAVEASTYYEMEALLQCECSAVAIDVKVGWTAPVAATMVWGSTGQHLIDKAAGVSSVPPLAITDTISMDIDNAAEKPLLCLKGLLIVGANAGTLQLQQACQAAIGAGKTAAILAGSYLKLVKVS